MAVHFLDTSALVKHYVVEAGSEFVRRIVTASKSNIVIADLARAEFMSAITRRLRAGHLSSVQHDALKVAFAQHLVTRYLLIRLGSKHITVACGLIERHGVRAYDAVQLATALAVRGAIEALSAEFWFVSADANLLAAARSEGLQGMDPTGAS